MADRIKFAVSCTPIETLTDENSGTKDIVASEVGTSLGGNGDSINLANYSARTAAQQGYLNATVNYLDAVHTAGGVALSAGNESDFFFIKNTGYKFSSVTALGASTTDCVLVVLQIAAQVASTSGGWEKSDGTSQVHFVELAWLKPGQAILLPNACSNLSITQFGSNANDLTALNQDSGADSEACQIYVRTYQSDGTAASDGNAVELLAVT